MKLTLHIGTEKTGTTSIQRALAKDRALLAAEGILFPELFGSENHMEIAVASMDPDPKDELQLIEFGRHNLTGLDYSQKLRRRLAQEVGAGVYKKIIISNEHCHSRLRNRDAILRLLDLTGIDNRSIKVIVYLRRQDRLATSLHSTRVKLGGNGPLFPAVQGAQLPAYFDFERLIENYASVVGAENINVRLYEGKFLHGGDVVSDFYREAGISFEPTVRPRANTSLSAPQMFFLEQFNERFPLIADGKINGERGPIYSVIRNIRTEPRFRPQRQQAFDFLKHFENSNARIKKDYFPNLERATLFDDDFSEYPLVDMSKQPNAEELFDFIEAIWKFKLHK